MAGTEEARTTQMAVVHRTTDVGIDLPPGKSAGELSPTDYRTVEMDDPSDRLELATVHRPCESGIDLPAGKSAQELEPTDYRIVELES
jgi:hypothetical protein